jgi:hypothetical protein
VSLWRGPRAAASAPAPLVARLEDWGSKTGVMMAAPHGARRSDDDDTHGQQIDSVIIIN